MPTPVPTNIPMDCHLLRFYAVTTSSFRRVTDGFAKREMGR